MSRLPYYKVRTSPKNTIKTAASAHTSVRPNNRRKNRLIAAVVSIYLVASGLLGLFIFNSQNKNQAEAGQSANISSSLRFSEEKNFGLGENVEVVLTLQNTSVTETLNQLSLEVLSTKESIKWTKAVNRNTREELDLSQNKIFQLNTLSFGERAEYLLSGIYQNDSLDFLTVLGRINYQNSLGAQTIDTNRVYTNLQPNLNSAGKPISLGLNKEEFNQGEDVVLTLTSSNPATPLAKENTGKIYINKQGTNETKATFDCLPEDKGSCQFATKELAPDKYSAIFLAEAEGSLSNIVNFAVGGKSLNNNLVPNEQAKLNLSFDSGSVNGIVPIVAERVISQNQSPDSNSPCLFQAIKDGKVVLEKQSKIEANRNCSTEFNAEELPGDGIYKFKLANSGLEKDVSVVKKTPGLITLENLSPNSQRNQSIKIKAENIKNEQAELIKEDPATIFVYHKQLATKEEVTTQNGERIKIIDGKLETTIPETYFKNSGTYLIYFQSNSGKASDFLTVGLNDSNLAFTSSGIIVEDYAKLKVGESPIFKLLGITDKDGKTVTTGTCIASLFSTANGNVGTIVDGTIKDGTCTVQVGSDKMNKSGPLLISFDNGGDSTSLKQSKQVQVLPGNPTSFGEISLEYEPVFKNFANKLILGPVTDSSNNPTNLFDNNVILTNPTGEIIKEINSVSIVDGYAQVLLPASSLKEDALNLKIQDKTGAILASKDITTVDANQLLTLPTIPDSLENSKPLEIGLKYTGEEKIENCTLRFIKNSTDFIEEKIPYNSEEGNCKHTWNLNQYRDQKANLVQVIAGEKKYSKVLNIISGEAANLFSIYPEVRFNSQKEVEISLLTSPIVDIQGLPVKQGEVKWQYNGKAVKTPISNGFAKLNILASKLEDRDIRTNLEGRFLDLDLQVEASLSSISQTNNTTIYLGDFDIANQVEEFKIRSGSNYLSSSYPKIFSFNTKNCEAYIVSSNFDLQTTKTHKQGNSCYVQVGGNLGKNDLIFESNGFIDGSFEYEVGNIPQEVEWCNQENKCNLIQVKTPVTSNVQAIIYDEGNQYEFNGQELDNLVEINQNGLNPLKEYLVEVTYKDLDGKQVSHYNTILGEKLGK